MATLHKPLLAFWVVLLTVFAASFFALVKPSWSIDLPGDLAGNQLAASKAWYFTVGGRLTSTVESTRGY